ncbi:MAG TPA: ABC transporter permease [Jatrophihabitans sp.]|jgi:simple sugar transport system permease protein|uniref:ABC transporter permease n=1 Tax=Jatrophihabitans sp. TaxID=1932789 RepID=UPI002E06C100|nr:ABC transporter permease [Jatrophihabitans sp.]
MTVALDKNPAPEGPPEPPKDTSAAPRPGLLRRALDGYLYGNQVVVTVLAFFCALVVGAVLIALADQKTRTALGYFTDSPGDTFSSAWRAISAGYSALFRGAVFDTNSLYSNGGVAVFGPISNTLLNAGPLILGGLAVTVAFRTGLFNIGVQGQLIMGAICAGYVGFAWHLPSGIHLIVALVAGILGGAVWGGLVGVLKARTGAHEVITTIMLNYVAYYLLGYLLTVNGFQAPNSTEATTSPIDSTARLPHLFESTHFGLVLALLAAVGAWWLLTRSTLGFSLKAIGANAAAARTAGMSVGRGIITAMVISGALAGLVGCSQVLGTRGVLTQDVDAGFGFDAITVALLGRGSAYGTVLAGILFGAFRAGGVVMGAQTDTPPDVVSVIAPVMVLFIAAPALIRGLFRLRASRGGTGVGALAKGWNG